MKRNLDSLRSRVADVDYWKLNVLIRTHDRLNAEAKRGLPIGDPRSYASLARKFLAEYCDDKDLLAVVQCHNQPHASVKVPEIELRHRATHALNRNETEEMRQPPDEL